MKETRILLASVLKPVNDSRMFWKLGLSLAKLPGVQVQIAGFRAPLPPAPENILFYPIFKFKRLSLGRFTAPFLFFKLLWRLTPQVIILGTHELLLITLVYKIFRPCRIIYDVRENYYLNLTSQQIYSPFTSRVLAQVVRLTERMAAIYVSGFFLAEKSYAPELPFLDNKYIVLENKYKPITPFLPNQNLLSGRRLPAKDINLLYSGTISELYGVFRAVNLCEALNKIAPIFRLTIIGYCPETKVLEKLKALVSKNESITLIGGDELVPHDKIVAAIQESHMGLLPYQPHPSTFNCIPTKLFEYLGHALPVLVQQNPLWEDLINQYDAGLAIDYSHFETASLFQIIINKTYYQNQNLAGVYWQEEEAKLLHFMQKTILTV
ncbi:MAG: hypothetical protein JWQ14_3413 [Adhaeribacter sp.]|nr:hypothetical protein [Adhaeribacter sp.]